VPASWSVTYRFLVAGTAMSALAIIRREPIVLDRRSLVFAATLGLAQLCLNFNFVYRAEEHITSGVVVVVFALLLIPNAVLSRIFLGQRMGTMVLAGSTVAMAGIIMLFLHEVRLATNGPGEAMRGIGFTLAGILSASVANVMQGTSTAKRYPMIPMLAVAMLLGAAIDAAVAFVLSGPPVIEMRPVYLAGILYLGIFGSAIAFPLYFSVLRTIGAPKAA
jgi:drug/metabolite transporter (DMT)-like permease